MNKRAAFILLLLTLLFLGRVSAQLVEFYVDVPIIPNFEEWHSATIPYGLLLFFQLIILYLMLINVKRLWEGNFSAKMSKGKIFLMLGLVYFFAMIARHILGLTLLSDTVWFTSFLSIYFHYVLAAYLTYLGWIHHKQATHA
ncbi:hypothetical protein PQO03_00355 [Lentisphaera profundi]|uniref:Uncharacterized protein n=1 Tax=Lentisphaera profundi TaxID=1658616 RepID=A0ABY7VWH8_9BACT|nr:hypothetical protein [Lentisphaera profundi]WDE96418.1 hypothetical protein PQO03_00355 [Lentisphaera profundi]